MFNGPELVFHGFLHWGFTKHLSMQWHHQRQSPSQSRPKC